MEKSTYLNYLNAKNNLENVNLYENGLTLKEMQQVLYVIQESVFDSLKSDYKPVSPQQNATVHACSSAADSPRSGDYNWCAVDSTGVDADEKDENDADADGNY